jgi:hypothetical protein
LEAVWHPSIPTATAAARATDASDTAIRATDRNFRLNVWGVRHPGLTVATRSISASISSTVANLHAALRRGNRDIRSLVSSAVASQLPIPAGIHVAAIGTSAALHARHTAFCGLGAASSATVTHACAGIQRWIHTAHRCRGRD